MCKAQVKAKHERQNDDYATANTNPNSSSLNDKSHHIRQRLSQTITSRHCLLIAIALASLSAHACDDTVELQVTCDSGKATWFVTSRDATNNDTVTVGSCIEGRVAHIARVESEDIDTNGIVLCAQQNENVCYHLKWSNSNQIDVKNCDGYNDNDGDPICNYICHGGSIKRKGNSKTDDTDREPINGNIICDGSTDKAYTYECKGNIVRKTPCPLGCDENGNQCKTIICKPGKQYECKDGTLFKCGNAQDVATPVADNMACDEEGQVVSCDGNELQQETHTCANDNSDQVVWCRKDESEKFELHTSVCYPNTNKSNKDVCNNQVTATNTCTQCSDDGECMASGTDADQKVSCKEDLTGITPSTGTTDTECNYCYNGDVNNTPVSIGDLGCEGCVPNEYKRKDSIGSTLNLNDEVCYNGKFVEFNNAEGGNFLHVPKSNSNELWDFALNATLVQSEGQLQKPPTNQFPKPFQPTWRYYNCHNDDAMNSLTKLTKVNNADGFLKLLNNSNKCCQDVNSYYISQTGYRYYSVEKCTNIRLQNTNNSDVTPHYTAYAYTHELNDFLIGTKHDLLVNDYACLEAKDTSNAGGEADVRHMMFIKQKTNGDQESKDGEPKHGIYKVFECPENFECNEKYLNRLLCISNPPPQSDSNCKCKNIENIYTISCDNKMIAACPKGTKLD